MDASIDMKLISLSARIKSKRLSTVMVDQG